MRLLTTGFEMRSSLEFYKGTVPDYVGGRIDGYCARTGGLVRRADNLHSFYTRFAYGLYSNMSAVPL